MSPGPHDVLGLAPGTWDALATIATAVGVVLAGVAAYIAARQYRSGEEARRDQTRPYVVVSVQPSPADETFMDLVIENVGASPAHDVRVEITPLLELTRQEELEEKYRVVNARVLNEPIPMLPPGHAMRMFLDAAHERVEQPDLQDRYDARVRYDDGRGNAWDEICKLDLGIRTGMTYLTIYGMHHAAKALREIEKSLKKVAATAGQVEATVETRDERDRRRQAAQAERARLLARYEEHQRAAQEGSASEADSEPEPS